MNTSYMYSLTKISSETMYCASLQVKPLKSSFSLQPFWILGSKFFSPQFKKRHPGQFCLLTLLDDKSIEKRTFALHGHGIVVIDPTITWQRYYEVCCHRGRTDRHTKRIPTQQGYVVNMSSQRHTRDKVTQWSGQHRSKRKHPQLERRSDLATA